MGLFFAIFCTTIVAVTGTVREPLSSTGETTMCANAETLLAAADHFDLDPFVLAALVYEESRWLPDAESKANACGLTQVIPRYSGGYTCVELKDPTRSLWVGTSMLSRWMVRRKRPLPVALACYNAGNVCERATSARKYSNRVRALARRYRAEFIVRAETLQRQCIARRTSVQDIKRSLL